MTRRWHELSEPEREAARQLFVALETSAILGAVEPQGDTGKAASARALSISEFWNAVVSGRPFPPNARTAQVTPDDLAALLERAACAAVPRQAAAATDSGTAASRTGRGVRISLAASRSGEHQTYVTFEFEDLGMAPDRLIALSPDGSMTELALPRPENGVIQLLMADDDPAALALADSEFRVFLV